MRIKSRVRTTILIGAVAVLGSIALPASAVNRPVQPARIGAPVAVGVDGNEPIIKIASDGTMYISALEYLYVSKDGGHTWFKSPGTLMNNPANQKQGVNSNTDSSIDIDAKGRLYFTFDYPYAGTTAVCTSDDAAQHFACDLAALPGGTDRMWVTSPPTGPAFLTSNEALYHTIFFTSADRGASWTPAKSTDSLLNPNDGPPVLNPRDGLVYQAFVDNAKNATALDEELSGPVMIHVWDPKSTTPTPAAELTTPLLAGAALTNLAITPDGTIYVSSEGVSGTSGGNPTGKNVQVARSSDGGKTWTVMTIPGTSRGTAAFSWIATGANGHVGVIYYQSALGGKADTVTGPWDLVWAESLNANAAHPTWSVQVVQPKVHTGIICGTASCTGNGRFAGDFIGAAFDNRGHAHLTWVKDSGSLQVMYAGN